uniref:Uncharacterized protein n=1 Tax=Timema shepardi TaxID=629360 RepID=A0A7R9G058_TIMSH|nr:unnamed protein product [Timema shepardi]
METAGMLRSLLGSPHHHATTAVVELPTSPHARLSILDTCHRKIRLLGGGPVAFLGGLVARVTSYVLWEMYSGGTGNFPFVADQFVPLSTVARTAGLAAQHTLSKKKLPPSHQSTARDTGLSLPGSPAFLPSPSYVRMRTTVKHHVAGTVKCTVPYKDLCSVCRKDSRQGETLKGGEGLPHYGETLKGGEGLPHYGETLKGGEGLPHYGETLKGGEGLLHYGETLKGGKALLHYGETLKGGKALLHYGETLKGGKGLLHYGETLKGGKALLHYGETLKGGKGLPHYGETLKGG